MKKQCKKCNVNKDFSEFKTENSALCLSCQEVGRRKSKKYYTNNKEKVKTKQTKYKNNNPEKLKKTRQKYYDNNKKEMIKKASERIKKRKQNDPIFKFKYNVRKSITTSLHERKFSKKNNSETILGCTFEEFKAYIESKFEYWMSWDNYGKYNGELNYGWDLDHIIPLSSAKTEEDVIRLNHFKNLQPLCSKVNRDIKKCNF